MKLAKNDNLFKPTFEQLIQRCSVVKDVADSRDWICEASHPSIENSEIILPEQIDYSSATPEIEDQGDYGSCVGWAVARGLREWMHYKITGQRIRLSVRFVWMAAKESDHFEINSFVANAGTSLKTGFKVLMKYGVPEEKYYPYDKDLVSFNSLRQKKKFFFNAAKYRIYNYYVLSTNEIRKRHLANIGPFVATVPIDNSWMDVGTDGIVSDVNNKPVIGGHAIFITGYDDTTQMFKFKNSWGKAWGNKGFGFLSYRYAETKIWSAIGADLVPEV